ERKRALPQRRGEYVVDDERRTGAVCDRRDRADVDDVERWIGWAFEEERLRVRPHRRPPLGEIEAVDEGRSDAETWQQVLDHPAAGAEQRLGGNHVIAGPELADERRRHRRPAARGGACRLGAFEGGHALLEHGDRRIGVARIKEARFLAPETSGALPGAVVDETLREIERFGGFAEIRAHLSGVDEAGFRAIAAGCG